VSATVEGIVENGQVRLPANVQLPERSRVLVIVPDGTANSRGARVRSPRLADPKQLAQLKKQMIDEKA